MTEPCDQLHAYVDHELDDVETAAFEVHLADCEACNAELPRLLALMTALDAAAEHAADTARPAALPVGTQRLTVLPGGRGAPGAPDAHDAPAPRAARPAPRRRLPWIAAGVLALAAGVLLVVFLRPRAAPTVASLAGDLAPRRTIEARLSYPGADRYRALDVARGARSHENISMARLAQLEAAKDWHGVGVAALLAGDPAQATRWLAKAGASPAVDSDRAALDLLDGSPDAIDRALEAADRAVATTPDHAAARWNRALVLAQLNLPLTAALDFDRVAALGEPGWADEARTRAAALRADVRERRVRWQRATAARQQLLRDGTPVPTELLAIPGYMTIALYDAVRAAPSPAAALALLPMAQALDGTYRSDRLARYVRSIAASDFRVRKPLADSYRKLVLHELSPAATTAFLAQIQRGPDDLWLGAQVRTGQVASHLDEYRRRAEATRDPWFVINAEHQTAMAEIARGETAAAEHRMLDAIALAGREHLTYRAIVVDNELVALYRFQRDLLRAHREAQRAYRDTSSAGESVLELDALIELAAINQDRYAHHLARAYLAEILAWSQTSADAGPSPFEPVHECITRRYAYESLASTSLTLDDPARARGEVAQAPSCADGPTIQGALVHGELYREAGVEADAAFARASIAAQRALPSLAPVDEAVLTHIEGTLALEHDRAAGQRALRAAIAKAGHDPAPNAIKARAYSYAALALDAGRASDFAGVIDVLAESLGVARPASCALAVVVEGPRQVLAFADRDGRTTGAYVAARRGALDIPALVPADLVALARACPRVVVLARAPVLGAARLLPPDVAWSYLLKGTTAGALPPADARRTLVVANPEAPSELNLPALAPFPDTAAPGVQLLRGHDATPSRVLLAMQDASVIELHSHGYIANDVSEASYLVLSPEIDRHYEMTASDVARVKLVASPLVILGACHAAASSRSLEGGMGLAEAFLRSGARAVVASPDTVQDLGAYAFFSAVRNRALAGGDVATALRDERVQRRAADDAWITGVVVFE